MWKSGEEAEVPKAAEKALRSSYVRVRVRVRVRVGFRVRVGARVGVRVRVRVRVRVSPNLRGRECLEARHQWHARVRLQIQIQAE